MIPVQKSAVSRKPLISILAASTIFFCLTTALFAFYGPASSYSTQFFHRTQTTEESKNEILKVIKDNYIGDFPSNDKLAQAELKSVAESLDDPYSEYLPASENQKFQDDLNKRYEGVGISFRTVGEDIIAQKVLPRSPAEQAGVKNDDILKKVDDKDIQGQSLNEVALKVRGEKDTKVKLEFERDGQNLSFEITRKNIITELITLDLKEDTAVITISSFGEGLDIQMKKIAGQIRDNKNIKRIIVDLRSNTGGLLKEAIDVTSYFLDPSTVILQEKTKAKTDSDYSLKKDINLKDYPVSILVDQYTASASEIMAGALRDQREAKLVGQKTFGKGVVQKLFTLNSGDTLKLTIAEWLTPKGNTINKTGLDPDIKTKIGEDALKTEF